MSTPVLGIIPWTSLGDRHLEMFGELFAPACIRFFFSATATLSSISSLTSALSRQLRALAGYDAATAVLAIESVGPRKRREARISSGVIVLALPSCGSGVDTLNTEHGWCDTLSSNAPRDSGRI